MILAVMLFVSPSANAFNFPNFNLPNHVDQSDFDTAVTGFESDISGIESDIAALAGNHEADTESTAAIFEQIDSETNRSFNLMKSGIAGVNAMASLPDTPNSVALGMGWYGGHKAIAAGYTHQMQAKYIVKANASYDSMRNIGAGIGAAYKF